MDAQLKQHKIEKARRRVSELASREKYKKYMEYLEKETERVDAFRKAFRKQEYPES